MVGGYRVEKPLGCAWRWGSDAGGGERGVEGGVIPGGGWRRRRQLWFLVLRHRLMGLKWRPWAKDAGTRGPQWHGPGLNKPSSRVITRGPRDGVIGGLRRLTSSAAAGVLGAVGARAAPLLLILGARGSVATAGSTRRSGGSADAPGSRATGSACRRAAGPGWSRRSTGRGSTILAEVSVRGVRLGVVRFRSFFEQQV